MILKKFSLALVQLTSFLFKYLKMINFQTIAIFNYPFEIVVLKSILEHKEIPFLFLNENLIGINPMASIAYVGIQLKVHPNDFEIVQAILDNLNNKMEIV